MKITLSVACLYFATALSGCTPVVSVSPLYTDTEIKSPHLDQRLEGEWIMANTDDSNDNAAPQRPCQVNIVKSFTADLPYSVGFRCPGSGGEPEGEYTKYDFHLVSLNGATFFDARFAESREKEKHVSLGDVTDKGVAPAHLLGQVWIQQDFIRFTPLQSEWVEKNWPADFLVTSTAEKYNRVEILTNPTSALRDVLSRNATSPDAFSLALYLCRPGVDCDARAMDDQLTRTPDNIDVLAVAVKFDSKRGNIVRAIALQRHRIELHPDEAADQFELGRLLLLNRDFDGARRALAVAKEPSEKFSIKELVVRSFFLQGDFAGTVQAAKSLEAPTNLISADPIILSYFALHRLAKSKEAESYIREQAAAFVGPAQEHLFLLEVLGRVTDSWPSKDWNRSTYYYALNDLRKGKIDSGRSHLQDLVRMCSKDNLIGLAAQLELERLASLATE